jgi:hypothetical protein
MLSIETSEIDGGSYAETSRWHMTTTLQDKQGPTRYWDNEPPERAKTIMHELTHLQGTDDNAPDYINEGDFYQELYNDKFGVETQNTLKSQARNYCVTGKQPARRPLISF